MVGSYAIVNLETNGEDKLDWTCNKEVLLCVSEKRQLLSIIRDWQAKWIGHVLHHDSLLRDITYRR